jgi:hypothetical protein
MRGDNGCRQAGRSEDGNNALQIVRIEWLGLFRHHGPLPRGVKVDLLASLRRSAARPHIGAASRAGDLKRPAIVNRKWLRRRWNELAAAIAGDSDHGGFPGFRFGFGG